MRLEEIRVERNRLLKFRFRFLAAVRRAERESPRGMSFSERIIQTQRLRSRRQKTVNRHLHMVHQVKKRVAISKAGIGPSIVRVELGGFGEHLPRERL